MKKRTQDEILKDWGIINECDGTPIGHEAMEEYKEQELSELNIKYYLIESAFKDLLLYTIPDEERKLWLIRAGLNNENKQA